MTRDRYSSWIPQSKVYLPMLQSPPGCLIDFLVGRFPHICRETWEERFQKGLITDAQNSPLGKDDPYKHGQTVVYQRCVAGEPGTLEPAVIAFKDSQILVADKPHGTPVTPSGNYVTRSLLVELQQRLSLKTLTPAHRLDRDTAGLVLFSVDPETRANYHRLFDRALIEREYLAVAPASGNVAGDRWKVANRIERGQPWFRQAVVGGHVNAITEIELAEVRGPLALYRLKPLTGKKHQLRIHMASLGIPIAGDPLYSTPRSSDGPLQLLAYRLRFKDPVTHEGREFTSHRILAMWC